MYAHFESLAGKVAIVTGRGGGVGATLAVSPYGPVVFEVVAELTAALSEYAFVAAVHLTT